MEKPVTAQKAEKPLPKSVLEKKRRPGRHEKEWKKQVAETRAKIDTLEAELVSL